MVPLPAGILPAAVKNPHETDVRNMQSAEDFGSDSRPARRLLSSVAEESTLDDEPLILWSVSETLKHQGYTVVEARDVRSALAAAVAAPSPFR